MGLFRRMWNLLSGTLAGWIARRETRNPAAVYEAAINERVALYGKLRAAAAGVLYLRSKLGREAEQKTAEMARVRQQLDVALERDDDAAALVLIGRRDALGKDLERVQGELSQLTAEADAAKQNLIAFQGDILRLRDEKVRMLARLTNAQARLRLQETLRGLDTEADVRALEEVRGHVERLVAETQLGRDAADGELTRRLDVIATAATDAAARAELAELKRARPRRQPDPQPPTPPVDRNATPALVPLLLPARA